MEIKTKLSVKQNCWFIYQHAVGNSAVLAIEVKVNQDKCMIFYDMSVNGVCVHLPEEMCFATKQELIESL